MNSYSSQQGSLHFGDASYIRLAFALILLLAAAMRFANIGVLPLWLDEGYSWWDAQQSLTDLWTLVPQCDPHPPLYAMLLKLWVDAFGDGTAALRSLSAVAGVIATGFVMLAGREIGLRHALIAGLIFATAPFQVQFSQEARPYAMLALASSMLCFAALRLLGQSRHGGRRTAGAWAALAVGGALMLWLNNTAGLLLGAFGIAALALMATERDARRAFLPLLGAALLIALLWLPYLPTFIEQARGISADFWIQRPGWWQFRQELRWTLGVHSNAALGVIVALWALGIVLLARAGRGRAALLLGCLAALPVLLSFVVSHVATPIFLARALIGIGPPFAVGLACAFATLPWRHAMPIALALLICYQLWLALPMQGATDRKEPWGRVVSQIAEDVEAAGAVTTETMVLTVPNEMVLPLRHALKSTSVELPLQGIPGDYPQPGVAGARYPSGKCAPSVAGMDLAPAANAIGGKKLAFLITRRNNSYDPDNAVVGYLRAKGWATVETHTFEPGAITVYRLVQRSPVL